jgi:hypothetical protein
MGNSQQVQGHSDYENWGYGLTPSLRLALRLFQFGHERHLVAVIEISLSQLNILKAVFFQDQFHLITVVPTNIHLLLFPDNDPAIDPFCIS